MAVPDLDTPVDSIVAKLLASPGIAALGTGLPVKGFVALGGHDPHSEVAVLLKDLRALSGHFGRRGLARQTLATSGLHAAHEADLKGGGFNEFLDTFGRTVSALAPLAAPVIAAL